MSIENRLVDEKYVYLKNLCDLEEQILRYFDAVEISLTNDDGVHVDCCIENLTDEDMKWAKRKWKKCWKLPIVFHSV